MLLQIMHYLHFGVGIGVCISLLFNVRSLVFSIRVAVDGEQELIFVEKKRKLDLYLHQSCPCNFQRHQVCFCISPRFPRGVSQIKALISTFEAPALHMRCVKFRIVKAIHQRIQFENGNFKPELC